MREPFPSEEYITIVDNKGRERAQRVEYVVLDVRGEKVYITADGLAYTEDSLMWPGCPPACWGEEWQERGFGGGSPQYNHSAGNAPQLAGG